MKNINVIFLFILALFCYNPSTKAEQLITIFLKPYPVVSIDAATKKLAPKLNKPGKMANNRAKHILPASVSGIFATYGGFLTVSDLNGEIAFPRKHRKPFIYLIITEKMSPIIRSGNTIDHWELVEDTPVEMYKFEEKFDPDLKVHFWDVTQEPAPANTIIPLESIAIFADPKYIDVPLGISIFKETPHLILPDIYVKKGLNLIADALYVLNLTHYFGGIIPIYKKEPTRYSQQLTY